MAVVAVLMVLGVLAVIGLAVAGLVYLGYIYYMHRKYDHLPGPPRKSFISGHIDDMTKCLQDGKFTQDMILEWCERYGPIVRLNFLHRVIIFVSSPEAVRELLVAGKYIKPPDQYQRIGSIFGERFLGEGLVTETNHERWHRRRRIMDPAFSRKYLQTLMDKFNTSGDLFVEKLQTLADGVMPVSMVDMFGRVTLDVIAKVAFSMDLNTILDDHTPFPMATYITLSALIQQFRHPFMEYNPFQRDYIRKVREACRLLRKTGHSVLQERQDQIRRGEQLPNDIMTLILKANDEDSGLTVEKLVDDFVTFFIAGSETTANQLSFTLMELGRYPDVLEKLRAEMREVCGNKEYITYEDIGKLQYMGQVLKESLRMYPPATGTSRLVEEEMELCGHRIPGETVLITSTYIMGHMEKYYPEPYTFNPDRFTPDADRPLYTYFPFSLGSRSCIGQHFSQIEAKVLLCKFLQKLDFELDPNQSFAVSEASTLRPKGGCICMLSKLEK
ncbi:PREDICTED: cholesterol 24-hydroxylase-like [Branchiostoma belcheri]|uniref:Cholesterol 24-hydroxylase n=1 Tax=Branchiostoma belcheri TaxID=7741 RepID=A0A6P4YAL4_BRABE|nr:PREDICTED: cholesterol 24-hydroxylase-like [Branchiostoma belcheri]